MFLREIFKTNFQNGNWYIDPEEMYIREDYPEDPERAGIKPGVVVGEYGAVKRGVHFAGEVGYMPTKMAFLDQYRYNSEVYSGTLTLKAISTAENECESIAYLSMLSANNYADYIIGTDGIIHIDVLGYSAVSPYKTSSKHKLWQSDLNLQYVINLDYVRGLNEGTVLEDIDWDTNFSTQSEGSFDSGVVTNQESTNVQQEPILDSTVGVDLIKDTTRQAIIDSTVGLYKTTDDDSEEILDSDVVVNTVKDNTPSKNVNSGVFVNLVKDLKREDIIDVGIYSDLVYDLKSQKHIDPSVVLNILEDNKEKALSSGIFLEFIKELNREQILDSGVYTQQVVELIKQGHIDSGIYLELMKELNPELPIDSGVYIERDYDGEEIEHLDVGVFIELPDILSGQRTTWGSSYRAPEFQSQIVEGKVQDLTILPGESVFLRIPFLTKGILSSIYLIAQQSGVPYVASIYETQSYQSNYPIYVSTNETMINYDVLDLVYINQDSSDKLYMLIENTSSEPLIFDLIRVRGIKL